MEIITRVEKASPGFRTWSPTSARAPNSQKPKQKPPSLAGRAPVQAENGFSALLSCWHRDCCVRRHSRRRRALIQFIRSVTKLQHTSRKLRSTSRNPRPAENTELRYVEPPVGTGNLLSVPQIRWCVREGIRIEAIRDVVDNHSEISRFNRKVTNYNNRCGNYSYYRGNLLRAERDVEPYRSQIIAKAIREATR